MDEFDELLETIKKLRKECPWDSEQTHISLRKYILEEAYELIEAIEKNDSKKIMDELGDVLLQVLLHTAIANENNEFNMNELLKQLNKKLIQRHPHVFNNKKVNSKQDVIENWVHIKKNEKTRKSYMDDLPALPGLLLAAKIQRRASALGFDWESIEGVYDKIKEEIDELKNADNDNHREEELGDLLFAVSHLSNFLNIDPEIAIHKAIKKFIMRFKNIEMEINKQNKKLTIEEMERIWQKSK